MSTRNVNVVFVQDSEPVEEFGNRSVFDVLYNVEGIILHGATWESIATVLHYLTQWDDGDLKEREDAESAPFDDEWEILSDGTLYTLYGNRDIGYVGLNAQIPA